MIVNPIIVLGPPEVFTVTETITKTSISLSNIYDSSILQNQPGYKLFLSICGLTYLSGADMRLESTYIETATTTQYKIGSCSDYPAWSISSLSWREVWFNTQNTKVSFPMLFKKMRISRLINLIQDSNTIRLEITELNINTISAALQELLILKPVQPLNLIATFKCLPGKKVVGSFLKSVNGSSLEKIFVNQNCYGGMNQIKFHATFEQADQVNQKINWQVSTTGIEINQPVLNQGGITSFTLMKLEYLDQ